MRKKCQRCGRLMSVGSEYLCWACHSTRHIWRKPKLKPCTQCGKKVQYPAKGLCSQCYSKKYMHEYHAAYERKRRAEGKDKATEKKRSQSPKRIAWRRAYNLKYAAEHKEEIAEYNRRYRRADLQRQANYKRRRIARVAGLPDTLTVEQWEQILKDHNYSCAYCGKTGVYLEREHKIPAVRGGGFTPENIVPACGPCNRRKRTMTDAEFREYIKKYP